MKNGVMDIKLFEYDEAFGTSLKMNKRQRMLSQDSSMTQCAAKMSSRDELIRRMRTTVP